MQNKTMSVVQMTDDNDTNDNNNENHSNNWKQNCNLGLLAPGCWLNDEVMNLAMEYLSSYAHRYGPLNIWIPNSYFMSCLLRPTKPGGTRVYSYESVKRWTQRNHIDVQTLDRVILPVNVYTCHWVCICIDLHVHTITVYDSAAWSSRQYPQERFALRRWITTELERNEPGSTDSIHWETRTETDAPLPTQTNGSDCGIFTYCFCRNLALNVPFTFSQATMDTERFHLWDRLKEYVHGTEP